MMLTDTGPMMIYAVLVKLSLCCTPWSDFQHCLQMNFEMEEEWAFRVGGFHIIILFADYGSFCSIFGQEEALSS